MEKERDDKVHRASRKEEGEEEDHFGCSSGLALNDGQIDSCAQGCPFHHP